MGFQRPPGRPFVRLLTVLLVGLLAACGNEERPAPAPPDESPAPPAVEVAEETTPAADESPSVTPKQIDKALDDLTAKEAEHRAAAVELLLANGYTHRELTHLALRFARWDHDVGTLADLLATYPDDVLPLVLHRIGRSAAVQRALVCRALGRVRDDPNAATAVLVVRALIDPDPAVRGEARLALDEVNPRAGAGILAHERLFEPIGDGSVSRLDPALLLGPGRPDVPTAYERYLVAALDAEAERFGFDSVRRVARFRAELGRLAAMTEQQRLELLRWDGVEEPVARFLVEQSEGSPDMLVKLLRRASYLKAVALAFAFMGTDAQSAAPALVEAFRKRRPGDKEARTYRRLPAVAAVCWALGRMQYRGLKVQAPLADLLEQDLMADDREAIEEALMVLAPSRAVVDRLMTHVEKRWRSPASSSAFRLLGWCHGDEHGYVRRWLERRSARDGLARAERHFYVQVDGRLSQMVRADREEREAVLERLRRSALGLD